MRRCTDITCSVPDGGRLGQLGQLLADSLALAVAALAAGLRLPGRAALERAGQPLDQLLLLLGDRRIVPGAGDAERAEFVQQGAVGGIGALHLAPVGEQLAVLGMQGEHAVGQILHLADALAERRVRCAEPRRHLGQRRRGRGVPGVLRGGEGLLDQRRLRRARIGARLPGRPAQADERVAMPADVLVDDRLDDRERGVLADQQPDRLAIGVERRRPVAARQIHRAEVGVAGRRERVVRADRVLADLERALEQRLGRVVALELDVDAAQVFERDGDRRAFLAVHLLAQAQGLRVVALGLGELAGALADQASE